MKRTRKKQARVKQTYIIVGISIVAIILAVGLSYIWASGSLTAKDSEIRSLQESNAQKDNEISSLQRQVENGQTFMKLYLKAMDHYTDEETNFAVGEDYYDWGSYYYDYADYEAAAEYWTYAMDYYFYADSEYGDAKALLETAESYAPNETYRNLAAKYVQLIESGAKIAIYIYEASEYYASASTYYSQGRWDEGNSQLAIGSVRIASHDDEVLIYNDLLSEIDSMIEML